MLRSASCAAVFASAAARAALDAALGCEASITAAAAPPLVLKEHNGVVFTNTGIESHQYIVPTVGWG